MTLKKIAEKAAGLFRAQPVLVIAFIAAAITIFIIPPDSSYPGYINRNVLIQLFALMTAAAGLRSVGVFDAATRFILRKTGNIRSLV